MKRTFWLAAAAFGLVASPCAAEKGFFDGFDRPLIADSDARKGWAAVTGDGEARIGLSAQGGHAVMEVDASTDRRGIWWAVIKRSVSPFIDQKALQRPDRELRVEARVRANVAPRRVNMSFNHSRTTDFHANLAEFDLADTGWHVISFTTDGFDARPGDEIFVQLAMIDWGIDTFAVELDYVRVDLVDPAEAGPDLGAPLPYRPPLPPPESYAHHVAVREDAIVDAAYPWVNFKDWAEMSDRERSPALSVSGSQTIVLRWDLSAFRGRTPSGWAMLELTTRSVQWAPTALEEFGYLRVAEILDGDPDWERETVTLEGFLDGKSRNRVLGQMIVDTPPAFAAGAKTFLHVSPPVLARLISGRTKGLAVSAQGALNATFHSSLATDPADRPTLHFSVE